VEITASLMIGSVTGCVWLTGLDVTGSVVEVFGAGFSASTVFPQFPQNLAVGARFVPHDGQKSCSIL